MKDSVNIDPLIGVFTLSDGKEVTIRHGKDVDCIYVVSLGNEEISYNRNLIKYWISVGYLKKVQK